MDEVAVFRDAAAVKNKKNSMFFADCADFFCILHTDGLTASAVVCNRENDTSNIFFSEFIYQPGKFFFIKISFERNRRKKIFRFFSRNINCLRTAEFYVGTRGVKVRIADKIFSLASEMSI